MHFLKFENRDMFLLLIERFLRPAGLVEWAVAFGLQGAMAKCIWEEDGGTLLLTQFSAVFLRLQERKQWLLMLHVRRVKVSGGLLKKSERSSD